VREGRAIPVERADRRQYRPAHRGEAPGEEGRDPVEYPVLWLEPGDVMLAVLPLDTAKANESMRLVDFTANSLLHRQQPVHQRIGGDREKRALSVCQPP